MGDGGADPARQAGRQLRWLLCLGILPGRRCRSCSTFDRLHEPGVCAGCGRTVAVKKDYCRLCWLQARLQVRALGRGGVRAQDLRQVRSQQLFCFGMHRIRQPGPLLGKQGRRTPVPVSCQQAAAAPDRLGAAPAAHRRPPRLRAV